MTNPNSLPDAVLVIVGNSNKNQNGNLLPGPSSLGATKSDQTIEHMLRAGLAIIKPVKDKKDHVWKRSTDMVVLTETAKAIYDWDPLGPEAIKGQQRAIFTPAITPARPSNLPPRARAGAGDKRIVRPQVTANPRRVGSAGHIVFEMVFANPGLTVEQYMSKGGANNHLQYDIEKGFIKLEDAK